MDNNSSYVYTHQRLDNGQVFYVGVGTKICKGRYRHYERAYSRNGRNFMWQRIVGVTDYIVEIVEDDISFDEACSIEKWLIKFYGRKDNGIGTLCNVTDGGEGVLNPTYSEQGLKNKQASMNSARLHYIDRKGHKWNEESKLKVKGRMNGFSASVEVRKKADENRKRIWLDMQTGVFYIGQKEVIKASGYSATHFYRVNKLINRYKQI